MGTILCLPAPLVSTIIAVSEMDGRENISRKDKSTLNTLCIRDTIRVAFIESPPSSKKLSWIPIGETPRISDHISDNVRSVGFLGGICSWARSDGGGGRRLRSSLPFAVMGKESMTTNAEGIIMSDSIC